MQKSKRISIKPGLYLRLVQTKGFTVMDCWLRDTTIFNITCSPFCQLHFDDVPQTSCQQCGASILNNSLFCDPFMDCLPKQHIRIDLGSNKYRVIVVPRQPQVPQGPQWKQLPPLPQLEISQLKLLNMFSQANEHRFREQEKEMVKRYHLYGLVPKNKEKVSYIAQKNMFQQRRLGVKTNAQCCLHSLVQFGLSGWLIKENNNHQLLFQQWNVNFPKNSFYRNNNNCKAQVLDYVYNKPFLIIGFRYLSAEYTKQRIFINVFEEIEGLQPLKVQKSLIFLQCIQLPQSYYEPSNSHTFKLVLINEEIFTLITNSKTIANQEPTLSLLRIDNILVYQQQVTQIPLNYNTNISEQQAQYLIKQDYHLTPQYILYQTLIYRDRIVIRQIGKQMISIEKILASQYQDIVNSASSISYCENSKSFLIFSSLQNQGILVPIKPEHPLRKYIPICDSCQLRGFPASCQSMIGLKFHESICFNKGLMHRHHLELHAKQEPPNLISVKTVQYCFQ